MTNSMTKKRTVARRRMKKTKTPASAHNYGSPTAVVRSANRPVKASKAHVNNVCSVCDPFCPMACGARLPDNNARRSIPYSVRTFNSIQTDSNGLRACLYQPRLEGYLTPSSSITNSGNYPVLTWSTTPGDVPSLANLQTNFDKYRIVSWGVRVFGSAAMSSSQGTVVIATLAYWAGATNVELGASNYSEVLRVPINNCDATWISKPSGPAAHEWTDMSAMCSRDNLLIGVIGAAASTNVVSVEVTYNIELLPKENLFVSTLATPPPVPSPVANHAVNVVTRQQPSAQNVPAPQRSNTIVEMAEAALGWALANPGEVLGLLGMI